MSWTFVVQQTVNSVRCDVENLLHQDTMIDNYLVDFKSRFRTARRDVRIEIQYENWWKIASELPFIEFRFGHRRPPTTITISMPPQKKSISASKLLPSP